MTSPRPDQRSASEDFARGRARDLARFEGDYLRLALAYQHSPTVEAHDSANQAYHAAWDACVALRRAIRDMDRLDVGQIGRVILAESAVAVASARYRVTTEAIEACAYRDHVFTPVMDDVALHLGAVKEAG